MYYLSHRLEFIVAQREVNMHIYVDGKCLAYLLINVSNLRALFK